MVKHVAKIGGEGPEFPNVFGSEHIQALALTAPSLGGGEGPEINLFGTEHVRFARAHSRDRMAAGKAPKSIFLALNTLIRLRPPGRQLAATGPAIMGSGRPRQPVRKRPPRGRAPAGPSRRRARRA